MNWSIFKYGSPFRFCKPMVLVIMVYKYQDISYVPPCTYRHNFHTFESVRADERGCMNGSVFEIYTMICMLKCCDEWVHIIAALLLGVGWCPCKPLPGCSWRSGTLHTHTPRDQFNDVENEWHELLEGRENLRNDLILGPGFSSVSVNSCTFTDDGFLLLSPFSLHFWFIESSSSFEKVC